MNIVLSVQHLDRHKHAVDPPYWSFSPPFLLELPPCDSLNLGLIGGTVVKKVLANQ